MSGIQLRSDSGPGWLSPNELADADSSEVGAYLSRVKDRLIADHSLDVTIDHQQK